MDASFSTSSDSDENIDLIWKKIRDTTDVLSLQNNEFKKRFRLSKEAFSYVFGVLEFDGQLSTVVPPKTQMTATLSLLSSGGFQHAVGNDFYIGIGQSSISKIIKRVVDEMEHKLCGQFIKFEPRKSDACEEYFSPLGKELFPHMGHHLFFLKLY